MKQIPSLEEITRKVCAIIEENVTLQGPLQTDSPLMKSQGCDSLDLIETSFCIQEFFDLEFSDRNALEALEAALGGGAIVNEGKLTAFGRKIALQRMPELGKVDLPEVVGPVELQQYFTVETFARLVHQFYEALPDTCTETGEDIIVTDFRPLSATSREKVKFPDGDFILDEWVRATAASLGDSAATP